MGLVSLFVLAVVTALTYSAEWLISWHEYQADPYLSSLQNKIGGQWDTRSKQRVVDELRASGADAVASYSPVGLVRMLINKEVERPKVLPLAGYAKRVTVNCNEVGHWLVVDTDRHGLRNPDAVWDRPNELAIVGDSFTFGSCLEKSYVELMRKRYPNLLNLGNPGSGALAMLGRLREYVPRERAPKTIVWAFFENDLYETVQESNTDMKQYLDPRYSQGLAGRQADVEATLAGLERQYQSKQTADFWKIQKLRTRAGLASYAPSQADAVAAIDFDKQLSLFLAALSAAKAYSKGIGADFVFLYIPQSGWVYGTSHFFDESMKANILKGVESLGVKTIDLLPAVMGYPEPKALYAFDGAHFSERGTVFIAQNVLQGLKRLGY